MNEIMLFTGMLVKTPYGDGKVVEVRSRQEEQQQIITVTPTQWKLASGQTPAFYLNPKDVKPLYDVGDAVSTPFGTGSVTDIRVTDQIYTVVLENWKLATGKSPVLYLNQCSLSSSVSSIESSPSKNSQSEQFEEYFKKAVSAKSEATDSFKAGDMITARTKYLMALEIMQHVSGELSNEQKAKLFEQTVTCNNNVALCCIRTNNLHECVAFAKNALVLIGSLESKIPGGEIWKCLQAAGISEEKLLKDWKKKSLYFAGKAELKRKNFQSALDFLEKALKLIQNDPKLSKNAQELQEMIAEAQKRRSKEKQKEKQTWSKAFEKNKTAPQDVSLNGKPRAAASGRGGGGVSVGSLGPDFSAADLSKVKVDLGLGSLSDTGPGRARKGRSTETEVWKPTDTTSITVLLTGVGVLGLLGGAAYWWFKLRKNR